MWWNSDTYLLRQQVILLQQLVVLNTNMLAELKRISDAIRKPPKPGPIYFTLVGETGMDTITFSVQLPALPGEPNDIESGELTVTIDGTASVYNVTKDATVVDGLSGPQNAMVDLSFVYIDDAGNRSANASTFSGQLLDTVPPPDAGTLGIVLTGEV